jgi:hypothetical protein
MSTGKALMSLDHVGVDGLDDPGATADLEPQAGNIAEISLVHRAALAIKTLEQLAENRLALDRLPVRNGRLHTIDILKPHRWIGQPVPQPLYHGKLKF